MAKALVPTPNTGRQHWERFRVLGRVLLYMVFGYSSVTGDVLYKEPLKLFDKSRTQGFLQSQYCHECAESGVNYIHPQSSHNLIVVSLLMEGLKIYIEKNSSPNTKHILISNFNIFKST